MNGIGIGLLVTGALYGFRHGFDVDHLAALTDIAGASPDRRRALRGACLYIAGHATVVLILGIGAVALGTQLSPRRRHP